MSVYHLGFNFPYEGFVQTRLEQYFTSEGYTLISGSHADLVCEHAQTKDRWVIEAKGKTTSIGLDFRTGLGQLLQRMDQEEVNYAVAVPDISAFVKQVNQLPPWVRKALNLHIIYVNEEGNIKIIPPDME
ncbi:MAG: hypothetical protein GXZ04_05310 [Clostridiales bacterium]|nr:hypothetical protein [Clostridiales bacterium]